MSLVNNSANNFKDFLDAIKPYLNYQFYDMSGQGVEANNFSTDEKVIGTWIDGKPLYQKTVDCGALPNNTTKTVAHGISNLDEVKTVFGYGYRSSDATSIFFPDNSLLAVWIKGNDIYLSDSADRSSYTESYVTLQYTKTTDSQVASGEKIVGQWIDGKPVYEKTITLTKPTESGMFFTTPIGASVDTVVDLKGWCSDGVHYWFFGQDWYNASSSRLSFYAQNNLESTPNVITFYSTSAEWINKPYYYATIRYTKTTD